MSEGLTADEMKIVRLLGDAWSLFLQLPDQRPSDRDEFSASIHVLQRHVMARLARRTHPEVFGPLAEVFGPLTK